MKLEEIRVLVVEDVNSMRIMTKTILNDIGFRRVSVAANAVAAKASLLSEPVDLILCDWYMDPISGIDFLKSTRAEERLSSIPFILVTAESTIEKVTEAIRLGVDDYLVKPFNQDQAQTKIYALLIRKKVLT